MELQLYLDILKRRAWVILIVTVVTLLIVVAAWFVFPKEYAAQSTVRILMDVGVSDFVMREDYIKRLLNTYAEVLQGEPMLAKALEHLSLPASSSSLVKDVSVEVVPNTELLTISVLSRDQKLAPDLANTLSVLLSDYSKEMFVGSSKDTEQILEEQLASLASDLEKKRVKRDALLAGGGRITEIETLNSQIGFEEDSYNRLLDRYELARLNESLRANSVTVIAPATLPPLPTNKLGLKEIVLALVIGLMGGIGLALVLENLDTHIHSSQQLERLTGLPVLGNVPRGFLASGDLENEDAPVTIKRVKEAYRLLCTNLMASRKQLLKQEQVNLEKIMITSAASSEGKSMVAVNLARTFADQGQPVFLVESDLRHPVLFEKFGNDGQIGLGNLLVDPIPDDDSSLAKLVCPADQPGLFIVTKGPKVTNPTALLASSSFEKLLAYLKTQGEVIVLDTPPVLGVADVSVLAPKVDGIILVVWQSLSRRETVNQALKQLIAAQGRVLGIVFVKKNDKDWS